MRKTLITLALAALPALVFSACNGSAGGGSGINPSGATVAPQSGVHRADNGPQDLHSGGATFPAYAYNLGNQPVGTWNESQAKPPPGSLFYSYGGTGTIYYCLTGSGTGRKEFTGHVHVGIDGCNPYGPGQTVNGFGARGDPLDFVGSDVPLFSSGYTSEPDCCTSGTYYLENENSCAETPKPPSCTDQGWPFEVPTIGGPIVYAYQTADDLLPASAPIQLSTWSYCAIANGTISSWNDPAIVADNGGNSPTGSGGVSSPAETITFVFREDGSGTSYWYQNHLSLACNPSSWPAPYNAPPYQSSSRSAAWPYGTSLNWQGPGGNSGCNPGNCPANSNFIGVSLNPGVIAQIQSTAWSTGYVEGAWAATATGTPIGQAVLENSSGNFESPTSSAAIAAGLAGVTAAHIQYGEGADGNPLGSSTPWCQLVINPADFQDPTESGAYPIVAISYFLFYGLNPNSDTVGGHYADKVTLLKYLASTKSNKVVDALPEYYALPTGIHKAILDALKGNKKQSACLYD